MVPGVSTGRAAPSMVLDCALDAWVDGPPMVPGMSPGEEPPPLLPPNTALNQKWCASAGSDPTKDLMEEGYIAHRLACGQPSTL